MTLLMLDSFLLTHAFQLRNIEAAEGLPNPVGSILFSYAVAFQRKGKNAHFNYRLVLGTAYTASTIHWHCEGEQSVQCVQCINLFNP